ncbi:MAG: glycerate kinase [Actinomycetaceae bacterium]|nr:glycerate kinase [Actinomycetaceae bacterium]
MRALIASDSFKGSLSSREAGSAIARGLREANPSMATEIIPLSDGGEGFIDAYYAALGEGEIIDVNVDGPNGEKLDAEYIRAGELAVIEIAQAVGLERIDADRHDPMRAHTAGVGQLIAHATGAGAKRLIIGLGGSATTDGGAGMLTALGVRLLDNNDEEIAPQPRFFDRVKSIDASALAEFDTDITVACDVTNPLVGPTGAAAVFGPQKGADQEQVRTLDRLLTHLSDVPVTGNSIEKAHGNRRSAGAGAAGGLGWALMRFLGARLTGGFQLLSETAGLHEKIRAADIVCTGEGKVDAQTLSGKAPAGVWELCQRYDKPLVIFAGSVDGGAIEELSGDRLAIMPITSRPQSLEDAVRNASTNLEAAALTVGRLIEFAE